MFNDAFIQSEIDYRASRARKSMAVARRGRSRRSWVRSIAAAEAPRRDLSA
ncbi:hypothetical protein HNR19_003760 [Nocardioides thalensis]|uniref:Uncharacterized protein n=1 Tax=Nocardioides thalensis TaxID=1914755 RepID=A0A853C8S7_9ACTN|nr:hypothetical protein [Nocardioides thalensis]NYJ03062.1 hypothetical protein [Nocardioides thalensis]